MDTSKTDMTEENISADLRFKKIGEKRNYFWNDFRLYWKITLLVSAITGCVSISGFALLIV